MLSAKVEVAVPTETTVSLDCFVMMIESHHISLPHSVRLRDYYDDLLHVNGIIYIYIYIEGERERERERGYIQKGWLVGR
jgi:hypothetical protein